MLNFLRRAVKSWVAKALIALLIVSFAVWGIGDIFSFRLDDAVAEVGEDQVSAERYADALRRERSRLSQQAGQLIDYDMLRSLGIDRRVLAGMIRDAAYNAELRRLGISAPDTAVAEAIRSDPAFRGPGGQFSDTVYRGLLAQQGMAASEFESLTRQLLGQQILTTTVGQATVPPGAAVRIAAFRGEERDVAYMTLPPSLVPEPELPDEAMLRAFYDAQPEAYTEPERRSGTYLHVDIGRLAEAAEIEEDAIRAAYEAEKDRFTTAPTRTIDRIPLPTAAEAEQLMARIRSGETDFDRAAAELGLAPDSLALGTVTPDDLPEVTAGPVFAATEAGVIGPVPTPVGSAIVRINSLTEGGTRPYEEVRDALEKRLRREAALDRAPDIANRIEDLRAEGRSLAEIAEALEVPLVRFEGLAADGSLAEGGQAEGFTASEPVLTEVFDAVDQEERQIVALEDGSFLLVLVERILPSRLLPYEDVADRVARNWRADARLVKLESRGEALAGEIAAGRSPQTVAEELGIPLDEVKGVTRFGGQSPLPPNLQQALFTIQPGRAVSMRAPTGSGVVVAAVTGVHPVEPEALAERSGEIAEVLRRSLANDVVEYYGRTVEARHGVRIDQAGLDAVFNYLNGNRSPGS